MPQFDRVLILGDFNIHVCCPSASSFISDFITLFNSFNLTQSVKQPSHDKGHTLDLVLSHGFCLDDVFLADFVASDHNAVLFKVPHLSPAPKPTSLIRSRPLSSPSAPTFCHAFSSARDALTNHLQLPLSVDELVCDFNNSCTTILDSIAPVRYKKKTPFSRPWMSEDLRLLKRQCRKAERTWKKDKHSGSLASLKGLMSSYQRAVKVARNTYFSNLIASKGHNPRTLFKTIYSVTRPAPSQAPDPSPEKCEEFLLHFVNKIVLIRQQFGTVPREADTDSHLHFPLTKFNEISLSSLEHIAAALRSSTCLSDCLPTWFLKSVFQTVGPDVLAIVNLSLSTGTFPSCFKHALVYPLLKSPTLDASVLNNFRPISKLPFLSKVLEKVVSTQLIAFLDNNDLFEKFQSGFRSQHSTETALIKVTNDLLLTADSGLSSILILLDLSSAFDTVDHDILISRLEHLIGISGVALQWFKSYLSNRSFSVSLGGACSSHAPLLCGVPRGSILGTLLFSIYMLPLGKIIQRHNINFHLYADDTQLYIPLKPGSSDISHILSCLTDIKAMMSNNFLQLNESKTEIILFSLSSSSTRIPDSLPSTFSIQTEARNLGVIFDSELSFDSQVTKVVQSCFWQLRQLTRIRSFLSSTDLEKVVHAFISSRLDYCNALYSGISK